MPIMVKADGGGSFEPAPAGAHGAVCIDVVDMGMVTSAFNGKDKVQHKIRIGWEIDEEIPSGDRQGQRFTVWRRYTASLHEKSSLRKDLASWRGRDFTFDELAGFDVEKLIGVPCMIGVVHDVREGKTYANVSSVMPIPKNMPKLKPSATYIRVKDREPKPEASSVPSHPDEVQFSDDDEPPF